MRAGGDGGLPIKLDSTSNGEFAPVPLPEDARRANRLAAEQASVHARRLGLSRRAFLVSSCGAASTLLAMNQSFGQSGRRGGFYALPPQAALEPELAEAHLGGAEFIFDVQSHHVSPQRPWRHRSRFWGRTLAGFPFADCGLPDALDCFSAEQFVKEIFLDSDTDLAVLSFVPEPDQDAAPLTIEEAAATRALVAGLEDGHRLLLHGPVHPGFPGELERMAELSERWKISAWKTYTQYGPEGRGYWLDDEERGLPFVERARALGVKVICVHKGFPLPGMRPEHSDCRDVGRVARLFPDVQFIIYHSGFETGTRERAYDPTAQRRGIDSLVRSLQENQVEPGSNVYAELGSTWRFLMRDPDQAAHALGKLLRSVGEDHVLWGTDSIWYGSPQDQIQAFRSFQISEELRERHGYPEITPGIRAKVFGLNATRPYGIAPEEVRRRLAGDPIDTARSLYAEAPDPSFATYGPRTRREFLSLLRLSGGSRI
ncbi:MAG: amidohydrolase family protein [Myxococcota bacterium]